MSADILEQTQGARFFRADLHIHSYGGSHDVKDTLCTPEAIVKAAKDESLDIIAIADHNEITNVAEAEKHASKAGLLLVPAIELSTAQGHLLCYLPTCEQLQRFYGKLNIADRGKGSSHCQQSIIECLSLVDQHGGFALFAHVDAGAGFETLNPTSTPHKISTLCHKALLGMELKSASSEIRYSDADPDAPRRALWTQRMERLGLEPQQHLARVLNSDSHTLKALGRNANGDRKVSRFKMNALNFESLHIALLESDARVRIEEELPQNVPRVVGIRMSGGFLTDQAIHFSSNLNCIIGGRGTGKSTTFEAIRCLSGFPGDPASVVDSDVWPDQVDLLVQDQSGQVQSITRAKGSAPEYADDPFGDTPNFPIECYRQGETHEISQRAQKDPAALLEYLDRFIDVDADLNDERDLRDQLLDLQSKIEQANEKIERIPKVEADLKTVKGQIAAVEKEKGKEVIAIQRVVAQERAIREDILTQANAIKSSASHQELKENIDAIKSAAPTPLQVGAAEYAEITQLATAFEADLSKSEVTIKDKAEKLHTGVQAQLRGWQTKAQATAQQVEAKKKALEAQGIRVDVAYFQKLANDEQRLAKELANLNLWKPHRTKLIADRKDVLKRRWECRDRIATKRVGFAVKANAALKEALSDLNVSLKFEANAYSPEADEIITLAMGWRTIQVPRASLLTESLTVPNLLKAIAKKDAALITGLKGPDGKAVFNGADAASLIERLGTAATLNKLERCEIVDRPRLMVTRMVKVGNAKPAARTREFNQLSLGQQQSVLLALMLSTDSVIPLIIDQPEDHLDSEFIYHSIVPVLRRAKERRQIIVVTHNANIAVLGDAEQIIVLKSNAEKSVITARGSIDDPKTRRAACVILEGAHNAFKRRARMYGFTLSEIEA